MSYPPRECSGSIPMRPAHRDIRPDGTAGCARTTWQTARAGRGTAPRPGPRWMNRGGLLAGRGLLERDNTGNLPVVPHLVHLGLEVLEVFLDGVGEAALLEQVLAHRLARAALHDGLGL